MVTQSTLEALPPLLDGLDLLVIDLDLSATNDRTPTAESLVEGFRFFRPGIPILTFVQDPATIDAARLADLDVDWHFPAIPHPDHLAAYARRCAALRRTTAQPIVLQIDHRQRLVRFANRATRLSPHELAFLTLLIEHAGDVVTRDDAVHAIWLGEPPSSDRAIDVLAFRIRQKLGDELGLPDAVRSVRGIGYRLARHLAPPIPTSNAPPAPDHA